MSANGLMSFIRANRVLEWVLMGCCNFGLMSLIDIFVGMNIYGYFVWINVLSSWVQRVLERVSQGITILVNDFGWHKRWNKQLCLNITCWFDNILALTLYFVYKRCGVESKERWKKLFAFNVFCYWAWIFTGMNAYLWLVLGECPYLVNFWIERVAYRSVYVFQVTRVECIF